MRVLILVLFTFVLSVANAQESKHKLTEQSTVRGDDGTLYPAAIWKALLMKGAYGIKAADAKNPNTEFVLFRLSEEERIRKMESLPKPRESSFFQTGKPIKLFDTRDINENKIELKKPTGKVLVFNFWFINCPPCRTEIPDLNELVAQYKGNDNVQFIGVALDSKDNLKQFLEGMPFDYQIINDGRFITDRYGIKAFPTHLIVDQEGKVYFHTAGLAQNTVYWVKKSIDALLAKENQMKP